MTNWEDYYGNSLFEGLKGETIASIDGCEEGSERIVFTTATGRRLVMFHSEDCCEHVRLCDVVGDVADLIGEPLQMAEVATSSETLDGLPEHPDSFTWTFYKLATIKGYVTLRWLGESNGYYSEAVTFAELSPGEEVEA